MGTFVEQCVDGPNPPLEDIEQLPPVLPTVPVEVMGPVEVRRPPSRRVVINQISLDTTVMRKILTYDLRRARVNLVGQTGHLHLATSNSSAEAGSFWPLGVALTLEGTTELWATTATAGGTVTVIEEFWAD